MSPKETRLGRLRITFVFFILHLSHAFHTRLCLPSTMEWCVWLSCVGDGGCVWVVPALLDARWTALTGFELLLLLFDP